MEKNKYFSANKKKPTNVYCQSLSWGMQTFRAWAMRIYQCQSHDLLRFDITISACDPNAYSGNIGQLISNSTLSGAATYEPTVEECWH
jgi:hypothetical protein